MRRDHFGVVVRRGVTDVGASEDVVEDVVVLPDGAVVDVHRRVGRQEDRPVDVGVHIEADDACLESGEEVQHLVDAFAVRLARCDEIRKLRGTAASASPGVHCCSRCVADQADYWRLKRRWCGSYGELWWTIHALREPLRKTPKVPSGL